MSLDETILEKPSVAFGSDISGQRGDEEGILLVLLSAEAGDGLVVSSLDGFLSCCCGIS